MPACPHREKSGKCYGFGIAGGSDAKGAEKVAAGMAGGFGDVAGDQALATLQCDEGCESDGTSVTVSNPPKVLVSVQMEPGLWLVVVEREWTARRECKPIG